MNPKHILVAPLDWGLGHATRCIPVIRLLINKGCRVSVASSGQALIVLKEEFPELEFHNLPPYNARYSQRLPFMIQVLIQMPKFLWTIAREQRALRAIALKNSIDIIISDNRYGCRLNHVPSIFIGHQLNIIMPTWLKWFEPMTNFFNHRWILRFDRNWIPDDVTRSLAGELSRPSLANSVHIGIMSRFAREKAVRARFDLAVVLSGPEPQRTVLEKLVLGQLVHLNLKAIVVRGLPQQTLKISNPNIEILNYLKGIELQRVVNEAEIVLCRPGYSSMMDLAVLGKKAILIPTPGQTEQEYLGRKLMSEGIAFCQLQNEFDLKIALSGARSCSGFEGWPSQANLLEQAANEILQ